jgi:hypothetical protein
MFSRLRVKYSLFFSYFNQTRISRDIFEKSSISNLTKIHQQGAEFFHADRRTDMTKLKSLFTILQTSLKRKEKDNGHYQLGKNRRLIIYPHGLR